MGALRLLEAYRQADAFCLPSCQEPLGLVLCHDEIFCYNMALPSSLVRRSHGRPRCDRRDRRSTCGMTRDALTAQGQEQPDHPCVYCRQR
jgi:hypothetical protein